MPVKGLYRSQGRIFNPPTENEAPIFVDSADSNKIKVYVGGTGDTVPVTLLTSTDLAGTVGKIGYGPGQGGAVTQTSSITTPVTLNTLCGEISTQIANTPAVSQSTFVVNNSHVQFDDLIIFNWGYSGPGSPNVTVSLTSAGFFAFTIYNYHATLALNGVFDIQFAVIGGSDN